MSRQRIPAALSAGIAALLAVSSASALDLDDVARRQKALAPPKLRVTPASRRVRVRQGRSGTVRLEVENAGGRTLGWRVTSLPKWLVPRKRSGSLGFEKKETLSLSARAGELPAGTHKGSLVLNAGAAGSVTVAVTMVVTPKPKVKRLVRPEPPDVVKPRPDLPKPPRRPRESRRRLPVRRQTGARSGEFGVRAGLLLPSSGDSAGYDSNFQFGVYYRPKKLNGAKIVYEVTLDFGATETSGAYTSQPLTGDIDLIFPLGKGRGKTRGYLMSGLGGMMESVTETGTGNTYTNFAGLLNLGGGMVFSGRLDARFLFAVLLGSENVVGRTSLSLGYGF